MTTCGAATCRAGKSKRGRRQRGRSSPASFIAHRRPLSERPAAAADRQTFGHWEADLMQFGRSGQAVLALHERHSRLLIAVRLASKAAAPVAEAIAAILGPLPPEFRQTVTFDNGTEFAHHYELHPWGIATYFCDTYSPWQKGGVENGIGRMRRGCRGRRTWLQCQRRRLRNCSERITIHRASASATGLRPRYSKTRCCTSNVNPPSSLRWNDAEAAR